MSLRSVPSLLIDVELALGIAQGAPHYSQPQSTAHQVMAKLSQAEKSASPRHVWTRRRGLPCATAAGPSFRESRPPAYGLPELIADARRVETLRQLKSRAAPLWVDIALGASATRAVSARRPCD